MGFNDVLKKSFIQVTADSMNRGDVLLSIGVACLIAVYIFTIYRVMTRNSFYNKNFNISLVALAIITTAIILSIQSSVVISLGMVGALSIVRFRTAIKEPMDLVFLFWSISIGIICGAGLFEIAIATSLFLTAIILFLDKIPMAKTSMMLVVDSDNIEAEDDIMEVVRKYSPNVRVKSRNMSAEFLNMVVEVRIKEEAQCIREVNALKGINNVSLISQDGEVTF
ncbi:uncharacterized protein DUF4956 [Kineothrix alysoides]|uniref:Uncharacterized protein DUF4956 n=1 Tax=Kineothrix alysoides TaxID=1469948 RepID=A0A4R1QZK4_9FIRM|nr:DUF4956 domain-containing protein [Kineothrix alysoides]TCL58420.1 uncharacterized protein DUF4956 [Kineothrix alysoides]